MYAHCSSLPTTWAGKQAQNNKTNPSVNSWGDFKFKNNVTKSKWVKIADNHCV